MIHKMGRRPNVGKTTLYKYLYFCDFDFYELFESFLIGESYRKIANGPAPCNFDTAIAFLERDGHVDIKQAMVGKYKQFKFISRSEPDTSLISEKELDVIDATLEKLKHLNAKGISHLSHKDVPWSATDSKDIIDYELVFYRTSEFSVRSYPDEENEAIAG